MKNNKNNLFSTIVIIGAIAFIGWQTYNEFFKEEEKEILVCSNYQNTTFEEIYEAKNNNELAARENYLNKNFNFSGIIESIEYNEFTKEGYMQIQNVYVTAIVYFNKQEQSKLKNYKKGSKINFCGTVSDMSPLFGALEIQNSIIN